MPEVDLKLMRRTETLLSLKRILEQDIARLERVVSRHKQSLRTVNLNLEDPESAPYLSQAQTTGLDTQPQGNQDGSQA